MWKKNKIGYHFYKVNCVFCILICIFSFFCCSPKLSHYENNLGYRIEDNQIIFEFDKTKYATLTKNQKFGKIDFSELQIDKVAVSGEFNNWSKDGWKMIQINENVFQLRKRLSDFNDKMIWQYKFVVNENYWVDPPTYIKNRAYTVDSATGKVYENMLLVLPSLKGNTVFKLKGHNTAEEIYLSGSFNDWHTHKHRFGVENGEWVCRINLDTGKYHYKFIVDKVWMVDPANPLVEYDNSGNLNSVLIKIADEIKDIKPDIKIEKKLIDVLKTQNKRFFLYDYPNAKSVVLTGSFDDWSKRRFFLQKVDSGWYVDLPLPPGRYEYKFLVDGAWMVDPTNPKKIGTAPYQNSVLELGSPDTFKLKGFEFANKVILSGSFNNWSETDLVAKRENEFWVAYVFLNSGKNHYKFIVDGEWILDPENALVEKTDYPNSVFLKGNANFEIEINAKKVALIGSFNNWNVANDLMVFDGKKWVYKLNILPGSYSYAFWVDGKKYPDPKNPNKDSDGNSILLVQ